MVTGDVKRSVMICLRVEALASVALPLVHGAPY